MIFPLQQTRDSSFSVPKGLEKLYTSGLEMLFFSSVLILCLCPWVLCLYVFLCIMCMPSAQEVRRCQIPVMLEL